MPRYRHSVILSILILGIALIIGSKLHAQSITMTTSNGLRLWLKADAGVNTSSDGHVLQWNDQSTNGNYASQLIVTNQPLLVPNTLNGLPVVRFDGLNDYLATVPVRTTGNDFSIFAVFKKEGPATVYHNIAVRSESFTGATNFFSLYTSNGVSSVNMNLWGTTSDCFSTTKINTNGFWIVSSTRKDKTANGTQIAVDGNPDATSSASITTVNMGTNLPIFIGGYGTKRAHIALAELIYYDRTLSQTERESVENYLGAKYGLPDEDGNGLNDDWERQYFGATGQDPNADPDGDGLTNLEEYKHGTNPLKRDTDNDGIDDKTEILQGRNPNKGSINDTGSYVDLKIYTPLE